MSPRVSKDPEPEPESEEEAVEPEADEAPVLGPPAPQERISGARPVEGYPDEVNHLGDQEAKNRADNPNLPESAYVPNAENVRRHPELFDQDTIDSFNEELPLSEAEAEVMGVDLDGNPLPEDEPEDEG